MKLLFQQLETLGFYAQRFSQRTTAKMQEAGLLDDVLKQTDFLSNPCMSERLYAIKHDITSQVKCVNCRVQNVKFISRTKGYRQYCSKKCQAVSPVTRDKVKKTMLARYNVNNAFNIPGVREKAITGNKRDEATEKRENTCLAIYGVKHNSQAIEVKEKKIKTSLARFGTEYSVQSDEIKQKVRWTCQERYGADSFFGSATGKTSVKSSMQEKYNVDNYMQHNEFREKSQRTLMANFGVDNPSKSKEIIEKIKQSHCDRHGNYFSASHIPDPVLAKLQNKEWLRDQHTAQKKSLPQIANALGSVTHKTVWNYFVKHDINVSR